MNQLADRPIIPKDGQKPRSEVATTDEKLRYQLLKDLPCAACRKLGRYTMGCDVQHMTDCGRRTSNLDTYPLCKWHHVGIIPVGFGLKNSTDAVAMFGPSFGKDKKAFEAFFGSEEALLAETNKLLGLNAKADSQ